MLRRGRNIEPCIMNLPKPESSLKPDERRRTQRRLLNRVGKIQVGSGTLPRDCLITDISDGGVRLHVEGYEVPDNFVLLLTGDDMAAKERAYRVVWRLGFEIGARFVGFLRRPSMAARG
jgi:PilZ domain